MRRATFATGFAVVFVLVTSPQVRQGNPIQEEPLAGPTDQVCDEEPAADYVQQINGVVDGDELELVISARFAGAVESLTWRGKEFINIFDHGRQISYAWHFDGYSECLNPTEPGTANDGRGLVSTSQLLSVCRSAENRITTTTRPAFWLAPGQSGFCSGGPQTALNETLLSDQILEKTIEIGYQGIDNVIAFTAEITLPEPHDLMQLEIPTGYLTYEFTDYWQYNPQSGELQKPSSQPIVEPWSFVHASNLPPILATPDGAYAMGAYTAEPIEYYTILAFDVPNLENRTNKWNIVIREEPAPAGRYTYQSFAIVGTLEQVQEAMNQLYALHPAADFNPPMGYVDVASCEEIAGWAWDPKVPNQPIEIEIYSVSGDGAETLLARTTADIPREDLPPVLGDNGEHGFRIVTSEILHDGLRHTLRAYAENSDPSLPNPALQPTEHAIRCPQFSPTSEPEPSPAATPTVDAAIEPATAPETGRSLPCLGGALPLAAGAFLWLQRRKR